MFNLTMYRLSAHTYFLRCACVFLLAASQTVPEPDDKPLMAPPVDTDTFYNIEEVFLWP